MRHLFRSLTMAAVVVGGLCLAEGEAQGGPIIQTQTFGPATTDWSTAFTFNQFNPALGTLNDVIITAATAIATSGTVKNTAANPQTFVFTEDIKATLTLPAASSVANLQPDAPATQSYTLLAAGATAPFGPFSPAGNASTTLTSASDLALFTGGGTFTMPASTASSEIIMGGGGNITSSLNTTASAVITVEYDFKPFDVTPEPASLAIAGIGVLGLAGYAWKRRKLAV